MITSTVLIPTLSIVCASSSAVWLDEDFESYGMHAEFKRVWVPEQTVPDQQGLLYVEESWQSTRCVCENFDWATRNVRVFDATNGVTGTDETPLHFSFGLLIRDYRKNRATFRTCELLNTQTGHFIAVGPRGEDGFEFFDGIRWHRLRYAPPLVAGWTTFELTLKTDEIVVGVGNGLGGGYEALPRAYKGGFGACAIGSGIPNRKCRTGIDNILVEGGTRVMPAVEGHFEATHEEDNVNVSLTARVRGVQRASARKPQPEGLAELESILDEVLAASSSGDGSGRSMGKHLLPWLYGSIAEMKYRLRCSPEEVQAVYYEAITASPDGWGIESAVDYLADSLRGEERAEFLWEIARTYPNRAAGRAAACALATRPVAEGSVLRDGVELDALLERGGGTDVPDEVLRLALKEVFDAPQALAQISCVLAAVPDALAEPLVSSYGRYLIAESRHDALESLVRWLVTGDCADGCTDVLRTLLYRSRVDRGDLLGALAAVSDLPLGGERAAFIARCAGWEQPAEIARNVQAWLARALREGYLLPPDSPEDAWPGAFQQRFGRALGQAAEKAGLHRIAAVVYEETARLPVTASNVLYWHPVTPQRETVSVLTGAPLRGSFGFRGSEPALLASFRLGQLLWNQKDEAGAHSCLQRAAGSHHVPLRGQALFDLARLHLERCAPRLAETYLDQCVALVGPTSPVDRLSNRIARARCDARHDARCYAGIARCWQIVNTSQDEREAVIALSRIAALELELDEPSRAIEALDIVTTRYPEAQAGPEAALRLAGIYQDRMRETHKAEPILEEAIAKWCEFMLE